jgi:hypothetical protein
MNGTIVGTDELENIWHSFAVAYYKVLSQHLGGGMGWIRE